MVQWKWNNTYILRVMPLGRCRCVASSQLRCTTYKSDWHATRRVKNTRDDGPCAQRAKGQETKREGVLGCDIGAIISALRATRAMRCRIVRVALRALKSYRCDDDATHRQRPCGIALSLLSQRHKMCLGFWNGFTPFFSFLYNLSPIIDLKIAQL